MNREQFERWKNRNDVVKIDTDVFVNLSSPDRRAIATVIWSHSGLPHRPSEQAKRFNIHVTKSEEHGSIGEQFETSLDLGVYKYLMVNCHEPNYAIVYAITMDTAKSIFSLVLNELPLLGRRIISKEENEGIVVSF